VGVDFVERLLKHFLRDKLAADGSAGHDPSACSEDGSCSGWIVLHDPSCSGLHDPSADGSCCPPCGWRHVHPGKPPFHVLVTKVTTRVRLTTLLENEGGNRFSRIYVSVSAVLGDGSCSPYGVWRETCLCIVWRETCCCIERKIDFPGLMSLHRRVSVSCGVTRVAGSAGKDCFLGAASVPEASTLGFDRSHPPPHTTLPWP